ncbi:MAG TPA: hypothetical protein VF763_14545 [Candidatus Limnocylindrales bacterium]
MARSDRVALVYAVAFVGFLVLPAAFRTQAPAPFPAGFYWQEVIDLFTPLVLIPLGWYLCALDDERIPGTRLQRLLFLVLAALWVEGQGMHLAANSIGRPWEHLAVPTGALAHYYDEVLSHYLWHVGILGVWGLAIGRSLAAPTAEGRPTRVAGIAGAIVLGVAWWMVLIESGTAPLDIPLTIIGVALVAVAGRRRLASRPIAAILGGAGALTLLLVAGWAVCWGGRLPQFTEVGLL